MSLTPHPTPTPEGKAGSEFSAAAILGAIQGWKWFQHVPPEAQAWLAERTTLRQFHKGELVYEQGQPLANTYGVLSGALRIYMVSSNAGEVTLEEVIKGGWLPHMSLESPAGTYLTHCMAGQDCVAAVIPRAVIVEFARRWPGYYQGLYEEFIGRATIIFSRIELLTLHNLNVRLAVYLLRMGHLRGKPEAGGAVWISAEDSQTEIGTRVGGVRQQVNRLLKDWVKRGWIELRKDGFRLLDTKALTAEATRSGFDMVGYLASWHGGWQGTEKP